MIKAIIRYSLNSVQFRCFELEMSVLQRPLMREQGMQLQFQFRDQQTDQVRITSKGLLDGYAPWSESPTALTLRALHALYTDWSDSAPVELKEGHVTSLQIAVFYVHDGTNTTLVTASATLESGASESYKLQRSIDGSASWPLQIRGESTAPLGVALKLLAFENSSQIDFSAYPPALKVKVTNLRPVQAVAITDVPDYARAALLAYDDQSGSSVGGRQGWIAVSRWQAFLAS